MSCLDWPMPPLWKPCQDTQLAEAGNATKGSKQAEEDGAKANSCVPCVEVRLPPQYLVAGSARKSGIICCSICAPVHAIHLQAMQRGLSAEDQHLSSGECQNSYSIPDTTQSTTSKQAYKQTNEQLHEQASVTGCKLPLILHLSQPAWNGQPCMADALGSRPVPCWLL